MNTMSIYYSNCFRLALLLSLTLKYPKSQLLLLADRKEKKTHHSFLLLYALNEQQQHSAAMEMKEGAEALRKIL